MKGSSSSDPDRTSAGVIKFILPVIVSALTRLVDMSFVNGVFPRALKRAHVIIRFRSGSRYDPDSNRPMSVLSVFSKIFDKAMLS